MTRRRRLAIAAAIVAIAAVLIGAPDAFAAAGGGSHSFGGGGGEGGGGGFGGGGGGRGVGIYILFQILIRIAVLGHGLGALVPDRARARLVHVQEMGPQTRGFWSARQRSGRAARADTARRERRVELAAAEAAEDDPAFAPDVVKPAAAALFTDIQGAWDSGDRATLQRARGARPARRVGTAPRRLRAQGLAQPRRADRRRRTSSTSASATAPATTAIASSCGSRPRSATTSSTTTASTSRARGAFRDTPPARVLDAAPARKPLDPGSIEQGAEGSHALEEEIVATPWADEQGMRDEALVEGAVADAVPEGTSVADVADLDFDGDARAAALDLSLADGRFAPDVLEVAARRAVAAWAEAVDGNDAAAQGDRPPRRRRSAAASGRLQWRHEARRPRSARQADPDRRA